MGIRSTAIENGKLKAGTYTVLVGSDAEDAGILSGTLTVTADGTYKFADVNADDTVDANDVTRLLRHTTGAESLEGVE